MVYIRRADADHQESEDYLEDAEEGTRLVAAHADDAVDYGEQAVACENQDVHNYQGLVARRQSGEFHDGGRLRVCDK